MIVRWNTFQNTKTVAVSSAWIAMIKLLLQLTWFARHYVCHLDMVRLCSCVSRDRGTKCHLVEACVAPYLIVSGRFIKNAIIPARSSTQRSRATSLWVTDFRVSWAWNRRCRIDFCVCDRAERSAGINRVKRADLKASLKALFVSKHELTLW